ncbi:hypothetical protein [Paraburkholderia caballeronis]|uniref:hypothetical protein n=1 Tax=Paraburkholderia caballeronis TaxID=416943 RepID=UPI0010667751|nr:hypothetical protein [Paraburkholderia caballeronis]TDV06052.1 hypothetical protein C7408_12433 [Paraburkholderia caballeronis]TDV09592.1 hypothetical protein C7406_12633 [Paraburkholderia caballeronis]TDV21657.1 hypothetical protein C7404_12133 [Paraburkholderia caballeronis]
MAARKPTMSADEKRWRAQSDAEALARAEEIRADRARHAAAKSHASKEAAKYARVSKSGGK